MEKRWRSGSICQQPDIAVSFDVLLIRLVNWGLDYPEHDLPYEVTLAGIVCGL